MIKTTRLKAVQAPRVDTIDLTAQLNGVRQTFSLPKRVRMFDRHYLVWNGQVYRNTRHQKFYSIGDNGNSLTTYFDEAPSGEYGNTLQLAVDMAGDGTDQTVTKGDLDDAKNQLTEKIDSDIADERTARIAADEALSARIDVEAQARADADSNLQSQLDAAAAASDVVDMVNTKAELDVYDKKDLTDKDVIKVLNDETQGGATTYYRYDKTTKQFNIIGEVGPYYTKAEMDSQINNLNASILNLSNTVSNINVSKLNSLATIRSIGSGLVLSSSGVLSASNSGSSGLTVDSNGFHIWSNNSYVPSNPHAIVTTDNVTKESYSGDDVITYFGFGNTISERINPNGTIFGSQNTIGSSNNNSFVTIIGNKNNQSGWRAVMLGDYGKVSGIDSMTLGNWAEASGRESVAIGSNSVADEDYVISVGKTRGNSREIRRRITNLGEGVNDNDAVTKKQMQDYVAANAGSTDLSNYYTKTEVNNLINQSGSGTDINASEPYLYNLSSVTDANKVYLEGDFEDVKTGNKKRVETEIAPATNLSAGVMSAADKIKLAGLANVKSIGTGLNLTANGELVAEPQGVDMSNIYTKTEVDDMLSALPKDKENYIPYSSGADDLEAHMLVNSAYKYAEVEIMSWAHGGINGATDYNLTLAVGHALGTKVPITLNGMGISTTGVCVNSIKLKLMSDVEMGSTVTHVWVETSAYNTAGDTTTTPAYKAMVYTVAGKVDGFNLPHAAGDVYYKVHEVL